MKNSSKRDVELLYEIGCLRFINRSWQRFLTPDFQNLAEHHFRVIWISLILAKLEGVKDTDKVMKMALIHDIAESRTGDVDYLQRQYVQRAEDMGMQDVLFSTILEDEFIKLWKEYEERKSLEARIVKDADGLDVDFELKEQEANGNQLRKHWRDSRKYAVRNRLYTKSAKKMWDQIQNSDPHDWHINARNRYNSGDWTKFKRKSK